MAAAIKSRLTARMHHHISISTSVRVPVRLSSSSSASVSVAIILSIFGLWLPALYRRRLHLHRTRAKHGTLRAPASPARLRRPRRAQNPTRRAPRARGSGVPDKNGSAAEVRRSPPAAAWAKATRATTARGRTTSTPRCPRPCRARPPCTLTREARDVHVCPPGHARICSSPDDCAFSSCA